MGKRPGRAGFAARVAQVLLAASATAPNGTQQQQQQQQEGPDAAATQAEGQPPHTEGLHELLTASGVWSAATRDGGALSALLAEQEGELCGPRPARIEAVSEEGGEVGSVITGEQLLEHLRLLTIGEQQQQQQQQQG